MSGAARLSKVCTHCIQVHFVHTDVDAQLQVNREGLVLHEYLSPFNASESAAKVKYFSEISPADGLVEIVLFQNAFCDSLMANQVGFISNKLWSRRV